MATLPDEETFVSASGASNARTDGRSRNQQTLHECIEANLRAARLTSPTVTCVGISINTSALDASAADSILKQTADSFGLPCVDPVRAWRTGDR